ncbi:sensor histidine kinase [Streptomyces sp. NBRC 109706]|uniref:sensor histidine kinase n=1 Tax=Streptomyces sp. NBRC 109706 TaxID=1550035 RepID=UPI0007829CBD|nr:sensor histidine kinase [Streptomyces sp. NBRC 109706]
MIALLLTGIAVLTAGVPAAIDRYRELGDTQALLDDAALGQRAVSLSHILADERDTLVVAAAGGGGALETALTDDAVARADRRVDEVREGADAPLRELLETLPETRALALAGESTPVEIHDGYTALVEELDAVLRAVSRRTSAEATSATSDALPDLARAVHASSAARGLSVAALAGDGDPDEELIALARREAMRETAALADFHAIADPSGRETYQRTVTGGDAEVAEEFLLALTEPAAPGTTGADWDMAEVGEALEARTGLQRGVLASLATEYTADVEALSDKELTELVITVAVIIVALLLALGVSVQTARSLTRPLAAVRLGTRRVASDPVGQEPVRYVGRNDEFAEVVASVNALRARAEELQRYAAEAEQDSGGLRAERDRLLAEQRELTARLAALHGAVHGMFAHHAQRLLDLVEEQLSVIEGLEEHETDPDQLAVLFSVDHLAARMRRHSENVLLLAGAEPVRLLDAPMPLIDVARAAVSEIERYDLVETVPPPPVRIIARAARDISHLLAELLDNAAVFTPPGARVRLSGAWRASELLLTVEDEGRGLSEGRLAELNARLADPVTPPPGSDAGNGHGIGMGLYTVARLAARHGLRCRLVARPAGGTTAEVLVPAALVDQSAVAEPGLVGETLAGPGTGGYPTVPAARTGSTPIVQPQSGPGYGGHDALSGAPEAAPRPGRHASPPAHAPGGVGPGGSFPDQSGGGLPSRERHGYAPEHTRAPDSAPAVTHSGLPVRTRVASASSAGQDTGRNRTVDAEELRRRLGGFQRGAREGHRDAALAADGQLGGEIGGEIGGHPGELPGQYGEEQPS